MYMVKNEDYECKAGPNVIAISHIISNAKWEQLMKRMSISYG